MLNKIVGYSGFRTYGELQYPALKQGKQLQLANEIWKSTVRQTDKKSPLDNFHNYKTLYKQTQVENTNPKDYHPDLVKKGQHSSFNFGGSSTNKPFDKVDSTVQRPNLLKTGTEHWKTNYQNQMAKSMSKTQQSNNNWNSSIRAQSTGKNSLQIQQQISKSMSYKNRPYVNNSKTGDSQYKFSIGKNIGASPTDLLNSSSNKQPLQPNPLKQGTNQLWTQIPGYQGFKPSQIPFQELQRKIQERNKIDKGNKKLNLIENYHVNVPGYSGFRSKYAQQDGKLRDSCFSYK